MTSSPIRMLCGWCRQPVQQSASALNRALREQKPVYCNKEHAGLARRSGKTEEQKKAEKREYDAVYRVLNAERIKAGKAEHFKRTYDPVKAAIERKATMARHVEYCRRPEYKAWKAEYDKRRNEMEYGEFAECWRLLQAVETEVSSQATSYERRVANGYYTRNAQKRRREAWLAKQQTN